MIFNNIKSSVLQIGKGVEFDICNPDPKLIKVEDIATALLYQNRYAGHLSFDYPVLNHTFIVTYTLNLFFADAKLSLAGLVHDDTEAIISDIPQPVKRLLPQFVELETFLWENAIAPAWGIDVSYGSHPLMVAVDKACWDLESDVVHFGDPSFLSDRNGYHHNDKLLNHIKDWLQYVKVSLIDIIFEKELNYKWTSGSNDEKTVDAVARSIAAQLVWGYNNWWRDYNAQIQKRVNIQSRLQARIASGDK